jgi:hypothetical protein
METSSCLKKGDREFIFIRAQSGMAASFSLLWTQKNRHQDQMGLEDVHMCAVPKTWKISENKREQVTWRGNFPIA